jgi:hypothetical protein
MVVGSTWIDIFGPSKREKLDVVGNDELCVTLKRIAPLKWSKDPLEQVQQILPISVEIYTIDIYFTINTNCPLCFHNLARCPALRKEILRFLVMRVFEKEILSTPHPSGHCLFEIHERCIDHNLPPINALAVNNETHLPGDGYPDRDRRWSRDLEDVLRCDDYPNEIDEH